MAQKRGSPRVTAEQFKTFLDNLKINGNVVQSSAIAGFNPTTAYDKRDVDEEFAEAWRLAVTRGKESLLDQVKAEVDRRGRIGWDELVTSMGKVVMDPVNGGYLMVKKFDSSLLLRLWQSLEPSVFAATQPPANSVPPELQADPKPEPDEPGPTNPVL